MRPEDEGALEAARSSGGTAPIWGGRWEATLGDNDGWAGQLHARYEEDAPMTLARSMWCWSCGTLSKRWEPFRPEDDAVLDQAFQLMAHSGPTGAGSDDGMMKSEIVTMDGKYRISFTRRQQEVVYSMRPLDAAFSMLAPLSTARDLTTSYNIVRGWCGEKLPQLLAEERAWEAAP
jgi:hypothetical protein